MPAPGLPGDLDQFAAWTHWLAGHGPGAAYGALDLSFGPVMTLVWTLLAALQPAFATAADASDLAVRLTLKAPAVLADLGLAAGVAWHLRERPRVALATGLAIALHPAVLDVSAWWGQYDAVYVLPALAAFLLVAARRPSLAAVALAIALMTKPQALPLVVPFAAWSVARLGLRGSLRPAIAGLLTIGLVWLPFLADGGPAGYLRSLAAYQDGPFGVLSVRAWNPWWIVQVVAANGDFALDRTAFAGPVTFRLAGLAVAVLLEVVVFAAVLRRPTTTTLAIGVAAASLVAFTALTTMHERYAYPALIFLPLAFPDRRIVAAWLALSIVFTLNLLAAAPPAPWIGALVPIGGVVGVAGSLAMTAITAVAVVLLLRSASGDGAPAPPARAPRAAS